MPPFRQSDSLFKIKLKRIILEHSNEEKIQVFTYDQFLYYLFYNMLLNFIITLGLRRKRREEKQKVQFQKKDSNLF